MTEFAKLIKQTSFNFDTNVKKHEFFTIVFLSAAKYIAWQKDKFTHKKKVINISIAALLYVT